MQDVKEIRGWTPVVPIPGSASHVLGVLNLRGAILPVIDLRRRLGMAPAEFTAATVIIVLSVTTAEAHKESGFVVDRVTDVVEVGPDALRPAPQLGHAGQSDVISGLATVNDGMLILLDTGNLLRQDASLAVAGEEAA